MITQELRNSLIEVSNSLQHANSELKRPEEDVVTFSICHHTHNAMKKMMNLYLTTQGINSNEHKSLDELFDLCHKANPGFNAVDITSIVTKNIVSP
jgi:hypothetical protein